ncbi:MAG: hypothetical protein JW889_14105 [Verrucomicrobia bacterium]|nr:hypothetical protein [Verrucomicrobiota bacterium]
MVRSVVTLVAVLAVTACSAGGDAGNRFQEQNPGYRTRAGTFYEETYLPEAVKGLIAAFAPQELAEEQAKAVLRDLIYDFLDMSAHGITRRAHAGVLARLDARIRALADGPKVPENYEAWKKGGNPAFPNPLSFLTRVERQSPPVSLALSDELKKEGWRVRSLESLDETGEYADLLGVEPYQVFVVERTPGTGQPDESLTLLVYRLRFIRRLIAAIDAKKQVKPDIVLQLFWRMHEHAVILFQAVPVQDDERLKEWVRRQWIDTFCH